MPSAQLTLLEFVRILLGGDAGSLRVRDHFAQDPQAVLDEHGLGELTVEDVRDAMVLLQDSDTVAFDRGYGTGLRHDDTTAFGAGTRHDLRPGDGPAPAPLHGSHDHTGTTTTATTGAWYDDPSAAPVDTSARFDPADDHHTDPHPGDDAGLDPVF